MNRSELIDILAREHDLSRKDAQAVLETLLSTIQSTVQQGGSVQLTGFGSFKAVNRAPRSARNPLTGVALKVPATTLPRFVPGLKFKAALQRPGHQRSP